MPTESYLGSIVTRDQLRNVVDVALSRVTALPRFPVARMQYANNRIVPVSIDMSGFHQFADAARLVNMNPSDTLGSMDRTGKFKVSMMKLLHSPFHSTDSKLFTQSLLISHESVHRAQAFERPASAARYDIPYFERPQEIEAYQLQQPISDFLEQVRKIDSSIFDENHPATRVSKLNLALTKLKGQYEKQLRLLNQLPDSERRDENILSTETHIELLTTQIETLDRRLALLLADEAEGSDQSDGE